MNPSDIKPIPFEAVKHDEDAQQLVVTADMIIVHETASGDEYLAYGQEAASFINADGTAQELATVKVAVNEEQCEDVDLLLGILKMKGNANLGHMLGHDGQFAQAGHEVPKVNTKNLTEMVGHLGSDAWHEMELWPRKQQMWNLSSTATFIARNWKGQHGIASGRDILAVALANSLNVNFQIVRVGPGEDDELLEYLRRAKDDVVDAIEYA